MATIQTQDFTTLVRNQVTAIQGGSSRSLVDLTVGSVLRAVVEASASVAMWLQGLILTLLSVTRAATSSGADLDSWVADFGVTRLAAVAASGPVTFARFTPTNAGLVPVGAVVQTGAGNVQYTVVTDTTNAAYSASLNGFVLAAGVASISCTVVATQTGSIGNAVAGGISSIGSSIAGVDTVTNAAAFANGIDPETDAALRVRFVAYIQSLSKATKAAVGYAITSVQQGLSYTLTENMTYGGVQQYGYFTIVVDDGSGSPPSALLSTVYNAIDAVRPVTVAFGVFAPTLVTATVAASITTAPGYTHAAIVALVTAAVQSFINGLGLGNTLHYTQLAQVIYNASPAVQNVTGLLLNAGTADIAANAQTTIKASSVAIS